MKKLLLTVTAFLGISGPAFAACTSPAVMHDFPGTSFSMSLATNAGDGNCISNIGIIGTLPAYAATPTFNLGTLNGAATAAKQPALGTAGSPSTDVISVQGVASGTPVPISAASLPLPALAATSTKQSDGTQKSQVVDGSGNVQPSGDVAARAIFTQQATPNTASVTNPTSTLTLSVTTTAYGIAALIANSATAGSVVVPSFAIANSAGGVRLVALKLTSNDSTSTAWGAQTIQIDLWSTAPTFTNGDRGAYAVATGTAGYLGSFTGVMSPVAGDGVYAVFAPTAGNELLIKLASGTSVFWTMQALTGSGVTGASKVFTLTADIAN